VLDVSSKLIANFYSIILASMLIKSSLNGSDKA